MYEQEKELYLDAICGCGSVCSEHPYAFQTGNQWSGESWQWDRDKLLTRQLSDLKWLYDKLKRKR